MRTVWTLVAAILLAGCATAPGPLLADWPCLQTHSGASRGGYPQLVGFQCLLR